MIFSFNKLKELINDHKITIDQMVTVINNIGFEVEKTRPFSDVEGIKFGLVKKVYKNPNGNKLNVCEIQFNDQSRIIQTTADGVLENQIIIAFTPGSRMKKLVFQSRKMKNIISEGMLSSPSEFGISPNLIRENHWEEITDYQNEITNINVDPIQYLELDDTLIDVTILPNRADANSYYVMANEICAYHNKKFEIPQIKEGHYDFDLKIKPNIEGVIALLETKKIRKISIKEQIFLAKHQIESVDDITDFTNLCLLYTGQPIIAHDGQTLKKEIKMEKSDSKVILSNQDVVQLEANLILADNEKPISLAGVMGLKATEIKPSKTTSIVFEIGQYNSKEVRKTIKKCKINQQKSLQASKKLSMGTLNYGLSFLTNQLKSFSKIVTNKNLKSNKKFVDFDFSKTFELIGQNLSEDLHFKKACQALNILGFEFIDNGILVPTYRNDVDHQQDIDEELLRFYGYENIIVKKPNEKMQVKKGNNLKSYKEAISLRNYQEVLTHTLVAEEQNFFNPFNFEKSIKLITSVSKWRQEIRQTQIISMNQIVSYHLKRKMSVLNLFSIGIINDNIETIALASTSKSLIEMQQDLAIIFKRDFVYKRLEQENIHEGVSANIFYKNNLIGWIGKACPTTKYEPFLYCEIITSKIMNNEKNISFKSYNNHPLKIIDITISLPKKQEFDFFIEKIREFKIFSIEIKDQYFVEEAKKITFRIIADPSVIANINEKYNS